MVVVILVPPEISNTSVRRSTALSPEPSDEIVKNDCKLNKNMIITGPNASGKTTTLKSALINIILIIIMSRIYFKIY